MEQKTKINSGNDIIRALAADYIGIYYVDTRDDSFFEYCSSDEYQALGVESDGEDFFEATRRNAMRLIHPDDREAFIQALDRENLISELKARRSFSMTYRILFDDAPKYVQLKAYPVGEGDIDHIVIGIYSINELVQTQAALIKVREEISAYTRLFALAGEYICFYTVDPEDESFAVHSASLPFEGLGLMKKGERFFEAAHRDSQRAVYPADQELFITMFTRERVMRAIARSGMYALNYRMVLGGKPVYVGLKAALVVEDGREQLIVGITDNDAQVKRDREYAHDLSVARMRASRDALTGVKNRAAYLDMEARMNRRIRSGEPMEFAVVVCDLNDLKQTNDSFGHQAGDCMLKDACAIICQVFKRSPVFRVGGDEFAVICQGHDYDHIDELMDRMRRSNACNEAANGTVIACGMARYEGDDSVAEVFAWADSRMYENKRMLKDA